MSHPAGDDASSGVEARIQASPMSHLDPALAPFASEPVVALTTFRRTGAPVITAVNIAVDGDRAFIRTWSTSGKVKRLRHTPTATIAPCTWSGRPTGPAVSVVAREVAVGDTGRAATLIRTKHPVLQGYVVPLAHRLTRRRTIYLEVRLEPRVPEGIGAGSESAEAR